MADFSILQSYNGIIRFYDGTVIAIEDQEYSADGIYNWEKTFNPSSHYSTLDGVTLLDGHKYKRIKHTGDTNFQLPYRITVKEPEFRVENNLLQWKFIEDILWTTLINIISLQGEKGDTGDKGIQGDGISVDEVGYFKLRRDCCASLLPIGCTSCNSSSSTTNIPYLFLSIGDGLLVISLLLKLAGEVIINTITYTHYSNDLINWFTITSATIDTEARYIATDGIGTTTLDMRDADYYDSRGKIYICADGRWTVFTNLSAPTYMVQEFLGSSNIGYLDNFVTTGVTGNLTGTITIDNGLLELVEYSVTAQAFDDTTFGDGIDYAEGDSEVIVKSDDIVGFGLSTYISNNDTYTDIQVNVNDFISDGLLAENTTTVDGETRDLIKVAVADLIDTTLDGLTTYTHTDGYDNLRVKVSGVIALNTHGISVVADELSLNAANLSAIKVYETDNGTRGILAKHINQDVVDSTKGLQKLTGVTGKLAVKLDATDDSLDVSALGVKVKANGIKSLHLGDSILDNTTNHNGVGAGLQLEHDAGLSVKLKNSGGILKGTDGLYLDTLNIIPAVSASSNVIVKSIEINGTGDLLRDDVKLNYTTGNGIVITEVTNAITDEATITFEVDMTYINNNVIPTASVSWGDINGTLEDQIDLDTALALKIAKNTQYGNMKIVTTGVKQGIQLYSSSGNKWYHLIVDAEGNLDTELV